MRNHFKINPLLVLFVLTASLVVGLVSFQAALGQTESTPTRGGVPFSVTLRPVEHSTLVEGVDFSSAQQSEFFPQGLYRQIEALAKNDHPEAWEYGRWAKDMLVVLQATVWFWEAGDYEKSWACLGHLEQKIVRLASLRENWLLAADHHNIPSRTLLEEIQLALERRAIFWRQALRAETEPSRPLSRLFTLGREDFRHLAELTGSVEVYFQKENALSAKGEPAGNLWCDYLDTKSFIAELEACRQSIDRPNRRVSTGVTDLPVSMLEALADRANVILQRLDSRKLTKEQAAYLGEPVILAWKAELDRWSADTVPPRAMLQDLEQYESHAGMSDMKKLFRAITRLSFSPTESYRFLGMMAHEIYGGANIKLYVSKVLVNHLLPPAESEVATFRDVIQGQQVYGRRQADLAIEMNFVPDEERILLSLDVKGSISTQTQARAFATTLLNGGKAECVAQKRIEMTGEGFQLLPTQVRVDNNRLQLRNFQTDFDGIPLISGLFRGAVQNQYESRLGGAKEETRRKIIRQVKTRIDTEANERFGQFNEKYRDFIATATKEFDLILEKKNASTEPHWLRTSWALRSPDSLCGNTPAPDTPAGAFADLKVHESAINSMLGKLEIDGKSGTVGEFRHKIAERFQRPHLGDPEENDNVFITFDAYNPLIVRFQDGMIELRMSIAALHIQGKTHRDFKVIVRYCPAISDEGELVLRRDKLLHLIGANVRSQFVLRAAFGKIFPEQRPVLLNPVVLKNDPRFENLTTGFCRIEKGWLAVALVASAPQTDPEKIADTKIPEKVDAKTAAKPVRAK